MSKKTRQTVTIIVLCVLLIGAGIGYYALIRYQSAQETEESQEEGITLYELDSSKLQKIHYTNDRAEMRLVRENNVWKKEENPDFPLKQTKVSLMADAVAAVTADRLVTDRCRDLAEFGLDQPDLTVELEDSDGNSQSLMIGKESLSGGGRYAYCGDTSKIYLLSTSIYSSFDYAEGEIMETPEFPTIAADNVTGLEIRSEKGTDFKAVYDEKNSPYKDIFSWAIYEPYSQPVAGDVDQLQTLFGSYEGLDFSEGVSYRTDQKELKKYGLKQPSYQIILDYYNQKISKKLQLTIGKQNKDKTGYYAQLAGNQGIYLMDTATVEGLVNLVPMQYVYQRLYAGMISDLKGLKLEYRGKTRSYTVKQEKPDSEQTDERTGEDVTYLVKSNGKEIDSEKFQNAFQAVSNLAPNGEIDSKVKTKGDEVVASFHFQEKKKNVIMNIYPYDGNNFYRIEVNGVMEFVVDIRTIDGILEAFQGL